MKLCVQSWRRISLVLALALSSLLSVATAAAQPRSITQFRHTAWSGVEVGGPAWAIDQGADGLLWIVTPDGLRLYDGQDFLPVPIRTQGGVGQPRISQILVTQSGEIWVGLAGSQGVAILRDGVLVDQGFPDAQRQIVEIEDGRDGSIWAVTARPDNSLGHWKNGRWTVYGESLGLPDGWISDVRIDPRGNVWVAAVSFVAVLRAGQTRFETLSVEVQGVPGLAMDASGRVWLGDSSGVQRLALPGMGSGPRSREPRYVTPGARRVHMAFAPDGDLWGALDGGGVFKLDLHDGSVTRMTQQDGLTGDDATTIKVDREGVVWVGGQFGVDAFVRTPILEEQRIPRFTGNPHMSEDQNGFVYVLGDGGLWSVSPTAGPSLIRQTSDITEGFCTSIDGTLVIHQNSLERFRAGRAVGTLKLDLPENVVSCVEDNQGRQWLILQAGRLMALVNGQSTDQSDRLGGAPAMAVYLDGQGQAYVTDWDGGLYSLSDQRRWRPEQLGIGPVTDLLDTPGGLIVGGRTGLARITPTTIQRLDSARHPWLSTVRNLRTTPAGDAWILGITNLSRISLRELDEGFSHPDRPLRHLSFDRQDGMFSVVARGYRQKVALSPDGRLWILGQRGLMRLSLDDLGQNRLVPPVTIRGITVAGNRLGATGATGDLVIPPGASPIQIDFVSGSLRTPGRVAYRYRLEGVDQGWVDAGSRRFAVYGRVPPGHHRFQVIASNDDGVWNMQGATIEFRVQPYFWQTWWFMALAGLGLLVILWAFYRLRLQAASARIRAMLGERLLERERIARDLHDTLMQGVQALILRFQVIAEDLPHGSQGRDDLDQALDRADAVLCEARERVLDLRLEGEDAGKRLGRLVAEGQKQDAGVAVTLDLVGDAERLNLEEADEIVGVAREALANALAHARASRVAIRLSVGVWRSVLTIDDDGQGVPAAILAAGARAGHFGLQGMRERASRIRGRLNLDSGANGTRITLTTPARYASAGSIAEALMRRLRPAVPHA